MSKDDLLNNLSGEAFRSDVTADSLQMKPIQMVPMEERLTPEILSDQ